MSPGFQSIIFETHATSVDNEAGIASGHFDAPLSALGERQASELGDRYPHVRIAWCSDLQRSYRTAEIAFGNRILIGRDVRLREIDYGEMTRASAAEIHATRTQYIDQPYPGGESYRDVCERVLTFLQEIKLETELELIIGHRATWYSLEHLLAGRDLSEVISAPWNWQPGWKYRALFS